MRKLIASVTVLMAVALGGIGSPSANAHLIAKPADKTTKARYEAQTKNLAHARYVCKHGANRHGWWACKAEKWLTRESSETRAKLYAQSTDWRGYLLRLVGPAIYRGCALPLISRESGGVVTKWNYQGSGAYGLGQALPASKMAPYGADYMTNGVTQIRWMNAYVRRYGGWCGANAFQLRNNWY